MKILTLVSTAAVASASVAFAKKTSPELFQGGLYPSEYSVVEGFFEQDNESTVAEGYNAIKSRFGLNKDIKWSDVVAYINTKNEDGFGHGDSYKLLFLARHGEGYHNIAPSRYDYSWLDWTCYWQQKDGNGQISWFDAELTSNGASQAELLAKAWLEHLHSEDDPVPLPQTFYVSPLRRTCQTFEKTWAAVTKYEEVPEYAPLVKDMVRETYGVGTESKRHNRTFISQNWPQYQFEEGFSELDQLWNPDTHESKQHRNYRSQLFLNELFSSDASTVVSLTSHSGFISSLLKTVNHRKFPLGTGQMIPVLVKASAPSAFTKPDLDEPWVDNHKQCKHYQGRFFEHGLQTVLGLLS